MKIKTEQMGKILLVTMFHFEHYLGCILENLNWIIHRNIHIILHNINAVNQT